MDEVLPACVAPPPSPDDGRAPHAPPRRPAAPPPSLTASSQGRRAPWSSLRRRALVRSARWSGGWRGARRNPSVVSRDRSSWQRCSGIGDWESKALLSLWCGACVGKYEAWTDSGRPTDAGNTASILLPLAKTQGAQKVRGHHARSPIYNRKMGSSSCGDGTTGCGGCTGRSRR